MRHALILLASILGLSVILHSHLPSQPLFLKVRKEDSHIGFSVFKWAVFKEEGRFRDFEGTIEYDPGNPSATRVDFTIRAASIDSRNGGRDDALRSRDFFHASKYPALTFRSTKAAGAEGNTVMVDGDLTIRGITKRVTVPVKVLGVNHTGRDIGTLVGFESTFVINREDFRVGEDWHIIAREATIHLLIGAGSGTVAYR